MGRAKEATVLVVLATLYLLMSIHYFPGNAVKTLIETGIHLLSMLPFTAGLTLLFISLFRRFSGSSMSFAKGTRVFLTIGIIVEFLYGIYAYLEKAA